MWPVDGLTIQIYSLWDGNPSEPRYVQIIGYGNFLGLNVLPNCRLIKNQDFKLWVTAVLERAHERLADLADPCRPWLGKTRTGRRAGSAKAAGVDTESVGAVPDI
jgi:hypothetical protein